MTNVFCFSFNGLSCLFPYQYQTYSVLLTFAFLLTTFLKTFDLSSFICCSFKYLSVLNHIYHGCLLILLGTSFYSPAFAFSLHSSTS